MRKFIIQKARLQKSRFDLATSMAWWQRNGSFNYQLYLSIINLKNNAEK